MNLKIDDAGILWIERAGRMKVQNCPRATGDWHCGDWCPWFGEPEAEYRCVDTDADDCHRADCLGCVHWLPSCDWKLEICQGRVLRGKIEDQRQKRGAE